MHCAVVIVAGSFVVVAAAGVVDLSKFHLQASSVNPLNHSSAA